MAAPSAAATSAGWTVSSPINNGGLEINDLQTARDGTPVGMSTRGVVSLLSTDREPTTLMTPPGNPEGFSGRLTTLGSNRVAVASQDCDSRRGKYSVLVQVKAAPGGATRSYSLPLATCHDILSVEGNTRGDLAVLTGTPGRTARKQTDSHRSVWLLPSGSKRFKRALRIQVRQDAEDAALALGARGDVFVAWENGGPGTGALTVSARYRTPGGRWLPAQQFRYGARSSDSGVARDPKLQVALTGTGRRYAIVGNRMASAVGTQRLQERYWDSSVYEGPVALVAPEQGDPLLAYVPSDGGPKRIVVSKLADRNPRRYMQTVSLPANSGVPTVIRAAVADNGAAIIGWRLWLMGPTYENQAGLMTAIRPAGDNRFSEPEIMTRDGSQVLPAISPDGSKAFVLFGERNAIGYFPDVLATRPL